MMHAFTTTDNRTITIRTPLENDAEAIIRYAKLLFASTNQVLTTPEEYIITVEAEKAWINYMTNSDGLTQSIILIAELDNEVIGLLDFSTKPKKKMMHSGEFGISVHPDFRSLGIGRALVTALLQWATNNTQVERVFLQVFASNPKAITLYTELGFIEEGRHIKAIKQPTGEYVDIIQMYKETI
jgi:RimJ/RimL family protein N-acetyltransferase